jgi:hypothetical protein
MATAKLHQFPLTSCNKDKVRARMNVKNHFSIQGVLVVSSVRVLGQQKCTEDIADTRLGVALTA